MKEILKKSLSLLSILVLVLATVPFTAVADTYAVGTTAKKCDFDFYARNDVLFYNPCAVTCGNTTDGSSLNITALSGADNREKIYNFWLAQGYSAEQSAGITGSIQHESGFSPFRQETTKTWPEGGYGIAQFTGGQRTAVTKHLKEKMGSTFDTYYVNSHGGGVTEANKFVPTSVPADVNDLFLLNELGYLASYISSFVPSTISARVDGIKSDYSQTVPAGKKLGEYLKTLTTATDAAIAWTYLYEYPGGIKATAATRGVSAETILTKYKSTDASSSSDCGVGAGGLTYAQGVAFMTDYFNGKGSYFASLGNSFGKKYINNWPDQCTTFVAYFTARFMNTQYALPNGKKVANGLASNYSKVFKTITKENVQPYTVFSAVNKGAGHTGIILGVLDDGSIVVGEGNAVMSGAGMIAQKRMGVKEDNGKGLVSVAHWESLDAWEKAMKRFFSSVEYATPVDISAVSDSVSKHMNTLDVPNTGSGAM